MRIYLAGTVPKGEEDRSGEWREEYSKVLDRYFDAEFIDPMDRDLDESDFMAIFGLDCKRIKNSDLVVVCGEGKIGTGTSQEMVIAKYFGKLVVTVLPEDSRNRKSEACVNSQKVKNWIHPFLYAFSDFIVDDVRQIGKIKETILSEDPKDISEIDEAVEYVNSLGDK